MRRLFYQASDPFLVNTNIELNAHEITLFGEHIPIRFKSMLLELDRVEFDDEKDELIITYNSTFEGWEAEE